jgi:hypothetical protein
MSNSAAPTLYYPETPGLILDRACQATFQATNFALGAVLTTAAWRAIQHIPDQRLALGASVAALGLVPAALAVVIDKKSQLTIKELLVGMPPGFYTSWASTAALSLYCRELRFEFGTGYVLNKWFSIFAKTNHLRTIVWTDLTRAKTRAILVISGWVYTAGVIVLVNRVFFGTLMPWGVKGAVVQACLTFATGFLYARLDALYTIELLSRRMKRDPSVAIGIAKLLKEIQWPKTDSEESLPIFTNLDFILTHWMGTTSDYLGEGGFSPEFVNTFIHGHASEGKKSPITESTAKEYRALVSVLRQEIKSLVNKTAGGKVESYHRQIWNALTLHYSLIKRWPPSVVAPPATDPNILTAEELVNFEVSA